MSTHSFSGCFLTKVTLRSVQSRINKSEKELFFLKEHEKTHNCASMCMHIRRIKVMLSTLREKLHFWLQTCILCYALKLKSEKCSVNDPSSWKYKCYTGREHRTLDTEEGWREILSSSKGLAALSFLKGNQNHSSIITVLQTSCLAHIWNSL